MADKKYILIAEDDPAYGSVYKAKLTSEGYDVEVITRGDAVLPALQTRIPDLIILDLLMPGKNGFEVLAEIQQNESLKKVPCIVASNLSQDVDREKAQKNGAVDFFVKSDVSITEMVSKIKKYL